MHLTEPSLFLQIHRQNGKNGIKDAGAGSSSITGEVPAVGERPKRCGLKNPTAVM
jgi:hypothetical protein